MIYPDKIEEKIGFTPVREAVVERCRCNGSARLGREMSFMTDTSSVRRALLAVNEMLSSLTGDGDAVPLGGINDIGEIAASLRVAGSFPEVKDLVKVLKMLECYSAVKSFFRNARQEGKTPYPTLEELSMERLECVPETLAGIILKVLDPATGTIKDTASPELAEIRSRLRSMSGRIGSIMRKVMANAVAQGWVEADASPAMRDGRLVIPVIPMNKRKIPGIVHDESSSGKTLYIEPAEVVEANNITRELELEERREIVRILMRTAEELRPYVDVMLGGAEVIYELDFIRAKADYARKSHGCMPVLHKTCQIEWYHACHPVLQQHLEENGREIVPIDVTLTPKERILVISGPNAGGKSVCLKTVGTLQYMLQCGMLPPVYPNSHFGVFSDMFVDIGDDQSIDDDLSTYSSHLRNMKLMLRRGKGTSLFLIDEMGSGTEPTIGGALAQAILEQMDRLGMWGVVTTHYQNLKQLAEDAPAMVNGSMLYDRQLMQPLFKLSMGNPGSSFAVEIARKTGLNADIISRAEEIVGKDYINIDNYLLDIARDKRYWENKRNSIKQKEKQLEETLEKYGREADELKSRRREILDDARSQAEKIIDSSNALIENTIANIKKANAEREETLSARRHLAEERVRLSREGRTDEEPRVLRKAPKVKKNKPEKPQPAEAELSPGMNVKMDGGTTVGTILEISGKNAVVAFGNLKTTVALSRLKATNAKATEVKHSTVSHSTIDADYKRQLNFKQEIDLRGMRADEAVQAVVYFIDDAIRFSIGRVRILHGTGTGALKQAVRQYLSTVPQVRSYRDEDVRFGGAGITVVDLS